MSSQGIENEEDLSVEIKDSINEHAEHPQGLAVYDRSESFQNDTEPTDKGMYCYITHLINGGHKVCARYICDSLQWIRMKISMMCSARLTIQFLNFIYFWCFPYFFWYLSLQILYCS